jgi:A/G-specific adenine glycosylase
MRNVRRARALFSFPRNQGGLDSATASWSAAVLCRFSIPPLVRGTLIAAPEWSALRLTRPFLYLVRVTGHRRKITAIVSKLFEWYPRNARDLPWRKTLDPYAIWVSEIMLQQTQVKTVLPYWERWMKLLPNIQSLARTKPQTVHKLWEGLGYYTRVRNMQRAAQLIAERYHGVFPQEFERVLELPGVGRYTAGAICSIAFNQPKAILDGNVMRVLTRIFGITTDPREKTTNTGLWRIAEELVLQASSSGLRFACSQLNQGLMELGALLCTPKQPRCDLCPEAAHCVAFQENKVDRLPRRTRRPLTTRRNFAAFVIKRNGQVLVRQRPAKVVNAHLWEFPNIELEREDSDLSGAAAKELGIKNLNLEPFCTINHTITRYRIKLRAFEVRGKPSARLTGRWLKPAQLALLPFCSAHSKILKLISRPGKAPDERLGQSPPGISPC